MKAVWHAGATESNEATLTRAGVPSCDNEPSARRRLGTNDGWTVRSEFTGLPNPKFLSLAHDSSNNFYASGYDAVNDKILVASYDNDGAYRWSHVGGGTGSGPDRLSDNAVDTNGNTIAVGYAYSHNNGSPYPALIVKFASDGTHQWSKVLSDGSANSWIGLAIATDSSDNMYVAGRTQAQSSNSNDLPFVAKLDSSGAVQWARKLDHGGQQSQPEGIQLDSNEDIII